jgi:predicted transcriptional regulator
MYGMTKTTVYLPEDLRASLRRLSEEQGRSEAEIIRDAIRTAVEKRASARPQVPLIDRGLGDPTFAERVDELLEGFGRR